MSPSIRNFTPMRILYLSLPIILNYYPDKGSAAGFQRFRVTPESVEVMEGADVFLRCVVENQQGKAQWTKDGFALGFERQVPGYPRYSYAGDPSLGQHHLVISGITITEDGEYQCQVGPTQTNPPIWASANVTVLVAPTGINIVGWEDGAVVEVMAGASLTLECLVTDARPVASIMWHKDALMPDPRFVQERVEASSLPRRWTIRSRLAVTAVAEDDGKLYTCEADHPTLRESSHPLMASIILSVLHRPGPPIISGYKTGEVLVAGERRTLVCRVSGGNPRPWVTWHRQGLLLDDTTTADASGVINTHQLTATAADDGVIYECRVRSDLLEKPLVANVSLTVYYVPSFVSLTGPSQVEEGAPISLTCETSKSNPPASLVWRVQGETVTGEPETMVRVSTGGWVTTSQLTHYKVRSRKVTEVVVECKALNPAIDQTVTKTRIIAITKPAGPPRFEGDLHRQFLAGTTIDLLCSSMGGHPAPTIRIYKEEEEIPTEVVREMNVTRGRAKVGLTPADNGAKVTCEVTSVGSTSAPLTASARLTVTFAPWEVTGSMTPATVEEGALVSLSCESSSSLPPSNITWRLDGVTIDDATVTSNQGAFGGTSTRSEMQLRTTAGDNGKMFLCEADNGLGPAVHTTLTLHVLHSPVWVAKPPPEIDVYEGDDLVVNAEAAANPGPARYWWRRGEETLMGTGQELQLGRITRQHTGHYSVSAYSQRGSVNASFYLNVQYGPEKVQTGDRVMVEEGGRVSTQCSATGNPVPNLTWTRDPIYTHNSSGITLGSGVGVARLVIESATRSDTGVYFCHAHNVVASAPPAKTHVVVEQEVKAASDVPGLRGSWTSVGGSGRLVCKVRAAPPPTFVWNSQGGLILMNSDKYTIHEPKLLDGLVLWSSVLEVRNIVPHDYTKYHCTATNPHGSDSVVVVLNPPSRPHPPLNFTVSKVAGGEVWLSWTPNLDGGAPSGYTVKYRRSGSQEYKYLEVQEGGTSAARVTGLALGAEYTIAIQARNHHGRSHFVSRSISTLLGKNGEPTSLQGLAGATSRLPAGSGDLSPEPEEASSSTAEGGSRVPRLILLIMTLTGAALLVLNIAIIACFVRRRAMNRNPSASSSSKTVSLGTFGATPASTPGVHPSEVFLSLNTMSSNNTSSSPTEYKNDERPQPTCDDSSQRPVDITSSSSSENPLPKEGEPSNYDHDLVNFPTEPDICSLGSSVYDNVPPEDPRRRGSDAYPAEDQFSVCSNRSNNSRVYSQGFLRPLSSLGSLQQQTTPQLIQDTLQALPRQSQQQYLLRLAQAQQQLLQQTPPPQQHQRQHNPQSPQQHQPNLQPIKEHQHNDSQPSTQSISLHQSPEQQQQQQQPLVQSSQHQPHSQQQQLRRQSSQHQQTPGHQTASHQQRNVQSPQPQQQQSPQSSQQQQYSPQSSQQQQTSPLSSHKQQQSLKQPRQHHQASLQSTAQLHDPLSPSQPPTQPQLDPLSQPQHDPISQPQHKPHPQASPPQYQQLPQEALREPPAYSNLNPSDLFPLRSDNYHVDYRQTSFTTGAPAGYSTLGTRRHRQTPIQFATLQRPRSSRAHGKHNAATGEYYNITQPFPEDTIQLKPLRYDLGKSASHSLSQQENSGSSGYCSSPNREVNPGVVRPTRKTSAKSQSHTFQGLQSPQKDSVDTCPGSPPVLKGSPQAPTDATTQGHTRVAHNHVQQESSVGLLRKPPGESENHTTDEHR